MFTQITLPYDFNALEPFIDERTMRLHYEKHHAGYTKKLNDALENYPQLQKLTIEELLSNTQQIPEEISQTVINNGGGYYNHNLFWQMMTPEKTSPSDKLSALLDKYFGRVEKFKEKFSQKALSVFGSGWAWLIQLPDGTLKLKRNSFQNNPIMKMKDVKILLGIDVWEHAYYLKYQNRRAEYIENWWNVVNWEYVSNII